MGGARPRNSDELGDVVLSLADDVRMGLFLTTSRAVHAVQW